MDLKALEANYQPIQFNAGRQQQLQKKKKGFLLDQISTVGGIGGGILGSFVTPIAGTAAGAGLGSAVGEGIENALMGESLTKNVGKEAALGAVFGAGPIKLAKGGVALARGAGMQAASKAAMTPLRKKAGQAVLGAADDLAIKNFRLTPTQLKNFQGKFGEDAGQVIRKYGFQNADDITTKGIEPLQQQFDEAITGITGVTKQNLQKNLMKRVNALSKAGPSDSKALGSNLKSEVNALLKGRPDVLDASELNTIRRQFDDLVNYTEKAANPSRYGVNKRMADGIRETLQQADQTGNLKNVGRELQKLRQLGDNAARQGQLGRGSLPASLTNLLGGTIGSGAIGGPAGALGGAAATIAVNSPSGRRLAMSGAEKLGGKLASSGAKAAGQSRKSIAGRLGSVGALKGLGSQESSLEGALSGQSLLNSDTNMISPTSRNAAMNAPMNANIYEQYQNTGEMSSSPYTRENLDADIRRDPRNAKDYFEIYQMYDEVYNPTASDQDLSQSSKNAMASADNALNTIDQLENMFNAAGGGGGRLGGGIKNFAGTAGLNEEAKIYNDMANASVTQIAKALAGSGAGTVSDMDAKVIMEALARFNNTPNEARAKFAALRQRLEAARNNTMLYGGGSLEDALMQMQGAY